MLGLARAYEGQGKFYDAAKTYRNALEVYLRLPGAGPASMVISRNQDRLAMTLLKAGNLIDAEKTMRQALDIDIRYGSSAGRSVTGDENDLGVILYREGKYNQSVEAFQSALNAVQKDDTDTNLEIGVIKYNLAAALTRLNRLDEASLSRKAAID